MFITAKPSQRLGAASPDWDLLSGTGTPPEIFLPAPLPFIDNILIQILIETKTDKQLRAITLYNIYNINNILNP